ncbi:MAG: SdrD B-like domain-containing protein, partial [Anaerolineaceae bacterium]|nr:SdrD B-like domain-containing protein [Anaerolineaceae bacterium]
MNKSLKSMLTISFLIGFIVLGAVTVAHAFFYSAEINESFSPLAIVAGQTSRLDINLYNPNSVELDNASFIDSLIGVQPGLKIANPNNLANTCGGVVIATAGTTTISLSGGSVPPQVGSTRGSCTISVDVTSTTSGNLINTIPAYGVPPAYGGVGLHGTGRGGLDVITNTTPASATLQVTAVQPPSMSKSFTPNTVWINQPSQLQIKIINNDNNNDLHQATFTDTLPSSFAVAAPAAISLNGCGSGALVAAPGATFITLNNATIAKSSTCVMDVNVISAVQGQYTNTIPAGPASAGSLQTQEGVTNTSAVTANINVQATQISKAFNPKTIQQGDTSLLTITLFNPSGSDYTGEGLVDTLPTGLKISGTPASPQCGGVITFTSNSLSWSGGTIPAGNITSPGSCQLTALVTSSTPANYTNIIPAGSMTGPATNLLSASDSLTVQARSIGVVKSFGGNFIAGGGTSMTITLQNMASTTLTGVNFTDNLPANLTIVGTPTASVSCGGGAIVTSTPTSITLSNAIIPPGTVPSPGTCVISATVTSSVAGGYTNTIPPGDVRSDQAVVNNSSGSGGVTVYPIGNPATVSKAFQTTTILAGAPSRLRITITAPNDTALSDISISDTLPDDLVIVGTPLAAANPTTTCGGSLTAGIATNLIQLSSGTIASAGGNCTITVYVTSNTAGTHTNTIPGSTLATYEGRTDPNPHSAVLTVTSLSISKLFTPSTISPNGLSRLTISLQNTNLLPLVNVSLSDLLSSMGGDASNGVFVAPTANAATTCGSGTVTAVGGSQSVSLAGGQVPASDGVVPGLCTVSLDVQGKGSSSTRTNTLNAGSVTATLQGTSTTIHPQANATAALTITPLDIQIVKGFQPVLVTDGSSSVLSIKLTNTYPVPLSSIEFTDSMPANMVLANPDNLDVGACGGTLTGSPGDDAFSYSGGSLAANSNCTLTMNVTMLVIGNLTNNIAAGAVSTFEGASNLQATSASLTNLSGASVTKSFSPNPIPVGSYSLLTITIKNSDKLVALSGVGLEDDLPGALPSGLEIAGSPAPDPVNNCGGTLTADPGSQAIKLVEADLAADASCTLVIPVTSTVPNNYLNNIPANTLTDSTGDVTNTDPASDTLVVTAYSLGNRVWDDNGAGGGVANNGIRDGSEPGLSGVTVNLYQDANKDGIPDGAAIATTTTDSDGYYRFDNLDAGTYIVEIVPPAGYISSSVKATNPNNGIDNDNNGAVVASGAIRTNPVTIGLPTPSDAPTGETDPATNPLPGEAPDNQSDRTIDFGLFQAYSLGNRVWNDNGAGGGTANNGIRDGSEPGLAGVRVNLYRDSNDDGTPDGAAIAFTDTDANGYYRFDNLPANYYILEVVTPAGYISGPVKESNPNNGIDDDNNGAVLVGNNVRSNPVALGLPTSANEPTGETDPATNPLPGEAPDNQSNRTVDFGFSATYSLGNRVWDDNGAGGGTANNGIRDGTEPGLSGVTVNLYQDSNDDGTPDGAAIFTAITDGNGYYRFDGLLAGTYIVESAIPTGYSNDAVSDGTPNDGIDKDNNGVTVVGNYVRSNPVTIGNPAGSEPTNDNDPATNPLAGEAANNYSNRTVDFGFFHTPYSIGNRVWSDNGAGGGTANNGIRDGSEPGIAGVRVNLYRDSNGDGIPDGNAIASMLTDASGYYRFDNLIADTYIVEAVVPSGYTTDSINDATPNDGIDNDNNGVTVAGNTIRTKSVTIGNPAGSEPVGETDPATNPQPGEAPDNYSNRTIDFGFAPLASLGDRIWNDLNHNGLQDTGEPGVTGAKVDLYTSAGTFLATTNSSGGGSYSFNNLAPGSYYEVFTPPSGYVITLQNQGSDSTIDSDADPTSGKTATITLTAGDNDTSWDTGIYQPVASLGDFVWNDLNQNGIQDAGEPGIPGVKVQLYRPGYGPDGIPFTPDDALPVTSTTTDSNGNYSFTDLIPGTYYETFTAPAGYAFTLQDQGSDAALDSNPNPANGQTAPTALSAGQNDQSWDAGLYQLASLGDRVWNDANQNGLQDAGETGINGATVRLYTEAGTFIASTTTATIAGLDGSYRFNNLVPRSYYLVFSAPGGYAFTLKDQGADDIIDSDADPISGQTGTISLSAGDNDMTWDAGLFQLASIGDLVWNDLNDNGLQDAGETGKDGITVSLFRPGYGPDGIPGTTDDSDAVTSTTTAGGGKYLFSNLLPGQYFVQFTAPAGYSFSPKDQGGDDTIDSDADPTTGQTDLVTLAPGQSDLSWDAGLYQLKSSIGDRVWLDTNGNGLQDAGETGLNGVSVDLYDGTGVKIASATTQNVAGVDGIYSFTNLIPGYYYLVFNPPSGYSITLVDQGSDDAIDSDADPTTGRTATTLLSPGQNDMTWDAGMVQPTSVGDFVWNDMNGNGIQDTGEPGIPNAKVDLYRVGSGQVATTNTDSAGAYLFDNLVPGDYYLIFTPPSGYVVSPQNQGGDSSKDSDADPTAGANYGKTVPFTLLSGQADLTWDAGLYQPPSLGDFVWVDKNANGLQDAGEPGLSGVTVNLLDSSGTTTLATATTDSSGKYSFTNLTPGNYFVQFVKPSGYLFSPYQQGSDASKDSNADTTSGKTVQITLVSGQNDTSWDAGLYQLAALGDFVWVD